MLRFLVRCGSRVEDAGKAKKIVCTTYTLLGSDRAVHRPDWPGLLMFSGVPFVCRGWNLVRVPPRAQCFRRSDAYWSSECVQSLTKSKPALSAHAFAMDRPRRYVLASSTTAASGNILLRNCGLDCIWCKMLLGERSQFSDSCGVNPQSLIRRRWVLR
jgi:hypothetical protein